MELLYSLAPSLLRWEFIKFRPRRDPDDITYGGVTVKAASVAVKVIPHGKMVDIITYIPGFTQDAYKTFGAINFLLLDQALGEYDVEMRVGQISIEPASNVQGQTCSLADLPKVFDALVARK